MINSLNGDALIAHEYFRKLVSRNTWNWTRFAYNRIYYCFILTYFGQQIIFDYLSKLQKALIPNCHQFQDATDSLIASEEENDVDVNSTKRLKCPNSDCQTNQTYSKKYHLLRHFKTRMFLN